MWWNGYISIAETLSKQYEHREQHSEGRTLQWSLSKIDPTFIPGHYSVNMWEEGWMINTTLKIHVYCANCGEIIILVNILPV